MSLRDLSDRPFERAVVLVDAALTGIVALEAASSVAASVAERLEFLFVEDEGLHRAAAYPFTREVSLRASAERILDAGTIARDLRASAERARAMAEAAAKASRIGWRFQVVRGRVDRALADACVGSGLVALETRRDISVRYLVDPASGGDRPGASLLIAGPRARYRRGAVLLHRDDSPNGMLADRLAQQIARRTSQPLVDVPDLLEFANMLGIAMPQPQPWRPGGSTSSRPGIAIVGRGTWPRTEVLDLLLKDAICPVLLTGLGSPTGTPRIRG